MPARLLLHEKRITDEGDIIEIKVWHVSRSTEFPKGIKYSMAYIHKSERVLGYDNERGKGHHRHRFGKETSIEFKTWHELLARFRRDVETLRGELYGNES